MSAQAITEALVTEVNFRLFEECVPRIKNCLERLPDEKIWWRPNTSSNSIGNLILHLCGNVRQWIISGVGEETDVRRRSEEFDERGPVAREKLLALLDALEPDVRRVLAKVDPEDLMTVKPVQVYEHTVLTMLVHVTEHFSYHTGQIAWITKMLKDEDLGFYAGEDLG
ncbi:DinB family protein [Flavilitoribacter nigricans]|uniref:DUF1572 domain-containing protein n=1 Tax=Flavilitoribacter nigricans (strain ATCC 23147 / DSM 23189 / NBRC 102662 / NCIMB 1420 / SS-2) TaxID=1122177 RepID=A0A2D0N009_FLAN2|nr:DinB family protein [Flavilitoribacter nigricans]PHN01718.1 hypothetical protein CRP01_35825 [Flavilitoribacter nigricans DSM 23189 = NBRC 102662]